eukprot:11485122-Alexandrium_andersonii.AAC.1
MEEPRAPCSARMRFWNELVAECLTKKNCMSPTPLGASGLLAHFPKCTSGSRPDKWVSSSFLSSYCER